MESSSSLELSNIKIYYFEKKIPTLLNESKWFLKESHKYELVIINDKATVEVTIKNEVVSVTYEDAKAYFTRLDQDFISIHFPLSSQSLQLFEQNIHENEIRSNDWQTAKDMIKNDIQRQCGSKINKEKNIKAGGLQKVGLGIGKAFGALNKIVEKPIDSTSKAASSKVKQVKEKNISQENRSKWSAFKNKLQSINDSVNKKCRPLTTKISEKATKVGDNFDKSDNTVIKGIRNFSTKIRNSINKGFNTGNGEKTQFYLSKKGKETQMKEKKVEEEFKMESNKQLNNDRV